MEPTGLQIGAQKGNSAADGHQAPHILRPSSANSDGVWPTLAELATKLAEVEPPSDEIGRIRPVDAWNVLRNRSCAPLTAMIGATSEPACRGQGVGKHSRGSFGAFHRRLIRVALGACLSMFAMRYCATTGCKLLGRPSTTTDGLSRVAMKRAPRGRLRLHDPSSVVSLREREREVPEEAKRTRRRERERHPSTPGERRQGRGTSRRRARRRRRYAPPSKEASVRPSRKSRYCT